VAGSKNASIFGFIRGLPPGQGRVKRAHIHTLVRADVLPVRLLAEANALLDPGLAPFLHAWQEQKESIFLSSFRMPSNPG
jgi:hypothetical protein